MYRYFFVDLENTQSRGLNGIENLDKNDTVYIFYSENSSRLAMRTVSKVLNSKAKVILKEIVQVGENTLDYQIVALLGSLIATNNTDLYYIISEDKGYTAAIEILEESNFIDVGRTFLKANINEVVTKEDEYFSKDKLIELTLSKAQAQLCNRQLRMQKTGVQ